MSNVQSLSFSNAVKSWCDKTIEQMREVRNEAAKEVVADMQIIGPSTTYPAGKGGELPVMTGWLRSSVEVSFASMPEINPQSHPPRELVNLVVPGSGREPLVYNNLEVISLIEAAELDDTIFIGYTAAYAGFQDFKWHFVTFAAAEWPAIVDRQAKAIFGR